MLDQTYLCEESAVPVRCGGTDDSHDKWRDRAEDRRHQNRPDNWDPVHKESGGEVDKGSRDERGEDPQRCAKCRSALDFLETM